ncbi:reverse transcriptase domain-containing protein [Tanacetum coccineum]
MCSEAGQGLTSYLGHEPWTILELLTKLRCCVMLEPYSFLSVGYEFQLESQFEVVLPGTGRGQRLALTRQSCDEGTFKKKLTDKYCPKWEIKSLKLELWNLKVRGNDVEAYTQRFQELDWMCTKFLADKTTKIDKYIGGLPDNIHGNVMSARPKTLDFAIELANDLMDQKLPYLCGKAE